MRLSNTHFDVSQPHWQDYLPYLQKLEGPGFPDCNQFNALLAADLRSAGGAAIRFIPSTELDDTAYEHCIYTTGQVSTRPNHWHDLFNALVWMRFPRIKVAMNALHYNSVSESKPGTRGPQRDAVTLFDECGVIVFSQHHKPLDALANRNWPEVFKTEEYKNQVHHVICGHAMLEKYLSPYKAMTAKALLVKVDTDTMKLPRNKLLEELDKRLAELLLTGKILTNPACLTPLPLAGIPGWGPNGKQNHEFYADQDVFRPPPESMISAPIIDL